MTASDLYEWAAACARELEMLTRRSDSLRLRKTNGIAAVSSGGAGDPTAARALSAMSEEPAIVAAMARCERVVEKASEVTNAVGLALGPTYALALRLHYLEGNTWESISFELHTSMSTLYRIRRTAFSWVDSAGIAASFGKVDSL